MHVCELFVNHVFMALWSPDLRNMINSNTGMNDEEIYLIHYVVPLGKLTDLLNKNK